jgi:hypothetical protein
MPLGRYADGQKLQWLYQRQQMANTLQRHCAHRHLFARGLAVLAHLCTACTHALRDKKSVVPNNMHPESDIIRFVYLSRFGCEKSECVNAHHMPKVQRH